MKIKEVKWSRHVEKRSPYSRKWPLGRPRHRWGDINLHYKEIGWEAVDWICLANGRDMCLSHASMVMNLSIPWTVWNFLNRRAAIGFRMTVFLNFVHCPEFWTMVRVQKPSDSECYTSLSELFRFNYWLLKKDWASWSLFLTPCRNYTSTDIPILY
jgi:hypothetical protein